MPQEKNCESCISYKDGYCEVLGIKPCYPQGGCDYFSKQNERYEITAKLNLKKIIAESREIAQVLNGFADDLERIEKKYAEEKE